MREYKKLALLLALLFSFISCEDPNLPAEYSSSYGERREASPELISRLNYQSSSNRSISSDPARAINRLLSGPTSGRQCTGNSEVGTNANSRMTANQREFLDRELGPPPAPGGRAGTALPAANEGSSDAARYGYFRYKDSDGIFYGTKRTIWRIKAAGKILKEKGITMGIGDISKNGGGSLRPTHSSHQRGRDVDMRLISPSGTAKPCQVSKNQTRESSCFSPQKTADAIIAMVSVDPSKVRTVLIHNQSVIDKVNAHFGRTVAQLDSGHDDHIHFSWNE